jgi:phospholipid transport system substrate-binding protein
MKHGNLFRASLLRAWAALAVGLAFCLFCGAALAATPAETLIAGNIQVGTGILDNKQLTAEERKTQFESFLLDVTDVRRIALFTLGPYAQSVSAADRDGFVAAFQDYAVAVYRSYFTKYDGQRLTVVRSYEHAPGDFIVVTQMTAPGHQNVPPIEVDFRVLGDGGKLRVVDCAVAGIWLALAERDDFRAVLAQSKGDVAGLAARLHSAAQQY